MQLYKSSKPVIFCREIICLNHSTTQIWTWKTTVRPHTIYLNFLSTLCKMQACDVMSIGKDFCTPAFDFYFILKFFRTEQNINSIRAFLLIKSNSYYFFRTNWKSNRVTMSNLEPTHLCTICLLLSVTLVNDEFPVKYCLRLHVTKLIACVKMSATKHGYNIFELWTRHTI